MLKKLSRETLAEQVARNLLVFIQEQDLKPGNTLPPETQLAADLGVSRPIIREALKSLTGQGVIEVVSGKGAVVKPLDSQVLQVFFRRATQIEPEALIDLMELRKGIEVQAAALAAQRRTPDQLAKLTEIVATMRSHLHEPIIYVEADVAFHRLIASMAQNELIFHLVGAIREAIKHTLNESILRPPSIEQLEQVQAGHEAILTALAHADSEAARYAMAVHFDDAATSLVTTSLSKTATQPPHASISGH